MLGLACMAGIRLSTGPHHLLTFHPNADKLEHIVAFGATMVWFGQLFRWGLERSLICICLILAGIALEYIQHALGDYDLVEYGDMAADGIGVFLGGLLLRTPIGHFIDDMDRWLAHRFNR